MISTKSGRAVRSRGPAVETQHLWAREQKMLGASLHPPGTEPCSSTPKINAALAGAPAEWVSLMRQLQQGARDGALGAHRCFSPGEEGAGHRRQEGRQGGMKRKNPPPPRPEATADGRAQGVRPSCFWSGNASRRPSKGEPRREKSSLRAHLRL